MDSAKRRRRRKTKKENGVRVGRVDTDLKFDGIFDVNGKKLDPCDDYEAQHSLCPVDVKLGAGRRD
eukprot:COSAG02_NODE_3375_length_6847_cov_4.786752_3_plen_65_part_01